MRGPHGALPKDLRRAVRGAPGGPRRRGGLDLVGRPDGRVRARRQAHEALIHRVDAERAVGKEDDGADPELAEDGIEELLTVMVSGTPDWGTFEADGRRIRLEASDRGAAWVLALGRFRGTSPTSGRSYDLDAAELVEDEGGADAVVRGEAWLLDRWVWGRAGDRPPGMEGDESLALRLRGVVADVTQ